VSFVLVLSRFTPCCFKNWSNSFISLCKFYTWIFISSSCNVLL